MQTVHVRLGERSYPVFIGAGTLSPIDLLKPFIRSEQVLLLTNSTVAPLYADVLVHQFQHANINVVQHTLPDGEVYKDLRHVETIFDTLLQHRYDRQCTLLALGGGVVGDMGGFAAACYQRGVAFLQMPTTLLSQVDSSVGGKTGVNHALGKNMIGAFKQPVAVYTDVRYLHTLPDRELSAGLAEVIKYALIRDPDFFVWLEQHMAGLLGRDEKLLMEAIARSCQHKADIVAADELEQGVRAHLNLGHTFGHAIETHTGYCQWLHGEAVAVGLVLAARYSIHYRGLSVESLQRIEQLVRNAGLPIQPPSSMGESEFVKHMLIDKKVKNNRVHLIVLKEIGAAEIVALDASDLTKALTRVLHD